MKQEFIHEAVPELIVDQLNAFIDRNPDAADKLYRNYGRGSVIGPGTGPGESLMFFIYDDIDIAGKQSTYDLIRGGEAFAEIKSVTNVKKIDGMYRDLKFGVEGNDAYVGFLANLKKFLTYCESLEHDKINELIFSSVTEVNKSQFKLLDEIGDLNDVCINGIPKSGVDFRLFPDGTIAFDNKPMFNIHTTKGLAKCFKYLIVTGSDLLRVDNSISSFEKIKQQYLDTVLASKIGSKRFLFFDNNTGRPIRVVESLKDVKLACECVTWNTMKLQVKL